MNTFTAYVAGMLVKYAGAAGKKLAIKLWNWEVDRAKQREEKRNEEAVKFSNSDK